MGAPTQLDWSVSVHFVMEYQDPGYVLGSDLDYCQRARDPATICFEASKLHDIHLEPFHKVNTINYIGVWHWLSTKEWKYHRRIREKKDINYTRQAIRFLIHSNGVKPCANSLPCLPWKENDPYSVRQKKLKMFHFNWKWGRNPCGSCPYQKQLRQFAGKSHQQPRHS